MNKIYDFEYQLVPFGDKFDVHVHYEMAGFIASLFFLMRINNDEENLDRGRFINFDKDMNANNFSVSLNNSKNPHIVMSKSIEWINTHYSGKWNFRSKFDASSSIVTIDFYFEDSDIIPLLNYVVI